MVTKQDAVLAAAIEEARTAATEIAEPGTVGDHLGVRMEAERLATHLFACTAPAYRGWTWAVTVARVPRAKHVTVCETHLLPGEGALLAPDWLPYAQRLAPGDLGAGDVLPYLADDQNLEPGYEATGAEDVDQLAIFELGLGRPRVLSAEGRDKAAQRWYDGPHGPWVRSPRRPRNGARPAAITCRWPARCGPCSGSAPTRGRPATVRSSVSTTAAERTARPTSCHPPRSRSARPSWTR